MPRLETASFALGGLDDLSRRESPIHRLDARAKTLVAVFFIATVVSFPKYELSALLPLIVYPLGLMAAGGLPVGPIVRRMALALPFVMAVGAFNPLLDRQPLLHIGSHTVAGGWVSFASILLRFALTVMAALALVASTGFTRVCVSLQKLGLPRVLVVQLMFVYRYIFVLVEETVRMARAHAIRSGGRRLGLRAFGSFAGQLLLRTVDRADRVYTAMLCRGFDGEVRVANDGRFRWTDAAFMLACVAFFLLCRLLNLSQLLGAAVMEVIH